MAEKTSFTHRVATEADIPAIMDVMKASIAENMKGFLTEEEIAAAQETMGLDTTLLEDGTYFIIEAEKDGEISQDEQKKLETDVQKETDAAIKRIDEALKTKEQEIMQV